MADPLDVIVFGATGFTGKFTLPQVYKFAKTDGRNFTWGIAGRSEQKLKDVLVETAKRIGVNKLSSVPIIIADADDEESIKHMTARARIIINCCGPFQLYGEVVVKSCIETRTHYVDVTGELDFIEGMMLKYSKAAEEKGVYIVNACGFGCVPSDMGLVFLENNFKGTLNSVEMYTSMYEVGNSTAGPKANYGSWATIVNMFGNPMNIFALIKNFYTNPFSEFHPKLSLRFPVRKADVADKWMVPMASPDRSIIMRSQRYLYEHDGKRPVQVHLYALLDSFMIILMAMFLGAAIVVLAQFKFGRNFLLKRPKFFTAGYISEEGPSEEVLKRQRFSVTLSGKGWSEKLAEGKDQYKTPPNKAIMGRVSGPNPAYGFTCVALALCAFMILTERKKLPAKGGVYSTAAAFSKTSLIKQLQKNGVVFEVLSVKDL